MNSELQVNTPIKISKLTKLERRWYNEYLECFNSCDALKKAYPDNTYTADSIRSLSSQLKKSVFVKLNISDNELMDQMGLTDERLHRKLDSKLDAKRALVIDGKPYQFDDNQAQLKALELSYKLKGRLNDTQKLEVSGPDGSAIRINLLAGVGFVPTKDD